MVYFFIVFVLLVIGVVAAFASLGAPEPHLRKAGVLGSAICVGVIIALYTMYASYQSVPEGHVMLVKSLGGSVTGHLSTGANWIAPWQDVIDFDIRTQSATFNHVEAVSQENQPVTVDVKLNYSVEPGAIEQLYRAVGTNYFEVLVTSRLPHIVKNATAEYQTVAITPNRNQIAQKVEDALNAQLADHSIHVSGVFFDNISYSKEFLQAIEQKQIATQDALRAQAQVAQARFEAESVVQKARGEAEANAIVSRSLTPELLQRLYIERLNPNVQVIYLPSGQKTLLQLPK